jgi:hypothetical protein
MGCIRKSVWLLLCFAIAALPAVNQGLFIDRSGSMKPYYQEDLVPELSRSVTKILSEEGSPLLFAFGTVVTPLQDLRAIEAMPFSGSTYLDRVLDKAEAAKLAIAWMITDNVQDTPGAAEAGNTEVFYRRLRSDAVRRVTIFPIRQPPGHPGIVVYALLLDDAIQDVYAHEVGAFASSVGQTLKTEALRMKPLDRDTVQVSFVRADVGPRGGAKIFSAGKPIFEHLEIRFKSRFEHLEIQGGTIKVVESTPQFDSESLLRPERRKIDITPRQVQHLGAGDETEQVYAVDIDLGSVSLKKDLASIWKAAWGKSGEDAVLNLQFLIEVPQKDFHLRKQFLNQYHAASLQEAKATGKVYAVDQLPGLMTELVTEVRVKSPVVFRVEYPWWPALLWLALGAALVAIAVLAARSAMRLVRPRARDWNVRAETEAKTPLDCAVHGERVSVQHDWVGLIRNNGFEPAQGFTLDSRAARADLTPGLRLKVVSSRRAIYLIFEDKQPAVGSAAAAAPQLKRR